VHKGYIPTTEEAEIYGAQVYDEICDAYRLLKNTLADHIIKAVRAEMRERGKNLPPKMPMSTFWKASFFSFAENSPKISFKEALALYKERQEKLSTAIPEMRALNKIVDMTIKTTPENT